MLTVPQKNRVLYGLACADALGAATEFKTPEQIAKLYPEGIKGYVSGSPFGFKPGEATDDTQMTLAMVIGLKEGGLMSVEKHFQDWLAAGPPDVGSLTRNGLNLGGYAAWKQSGYDGAGNGGLMRVAGVNIAGRYSSLDELAEQAAGVTAVTHIDPRCILSSVYTAVLIEMLAFYGVPLDRALTDSLGYVNYCLPDVINSLIQSAQLPAHSRETYAVKLADALVELTDTVRRGSDGYAGNQSGYTMHTLQAAIAHNVKGKTWLEVAEAAALLGNDSDTAGAVAGAIAGARNLRADEDFLDRLRIGATWGDWNRKWKCLGKLEGIVGA
jgi:ADP-ribosyl-[dinitrogen reductase] hydrolase